MSDRVIAMMFTDLVSSTAIKLKLPGADINTNNHLYRDTILMPHRQRVLEIINAYDGRKVETIGDAFFLVFPNPVDAVECAVAIQQSHISDQIPTPLGPLQVTIGIHTGSPIPDDDRFIGHEVDYAARIAALASAEQILLSEVTAVLVRQGRVSGLTLHRHEDRDLKGIGPVPIFELLYNNKQPQPLKDRLKPQEYKNVEAAIPIYQNALFTQTETENLTNQPASEVANHPASNLTIPTEIHQQLQTLLANHIGPMASLLLPQALQEVSTLPDLVNRLAVYVPDTCRQQFQSEAKALLKPSNQASSATNQNPVNSKSHISQPVAKTHAIPATIEASFLQICERELAKLIGPMAKFIVQETISKQPNSSRKQLVEALAKQIPTPQKAQEFSRKLLSEKS
ncbi:MAG TPA: adenylate/guanylate cyclase domain-containing protein [Leptolyngbyaceae cyanobacterium]